MQYIATGVLKGPHGIKGSIKLKSFSGEVEHLFKLKRVQLRHENQTRDLIIDELKLHGNDPLIHFEGINTPEDARTLNGWELWVERDNAAPLELGEFYVADLMDSSIIVDGLKVGFVKAILDGPQSLLLEVTHGDDKKVSLVPFMAPFIGSVDIEKKEIELLIADLLL